MWIDVDGEVNLVSEKAMKIFISGAKGLVLAGDAGKGLRKLLDAMKQAMESDEVVHVAFEKDIPGSASSMATHFLADLFDDKEGK